MEIEEIPDEELVPDSLDIRQGREEVLQSIKQIRQMMREKGLSKSNAHFVLAMVVRSLLLRWP